MPSYILGIDQGTTQTTAVVLDETGLVVARKSVQVPISFPRPGWVEQDPWDLLNSVKQASTGFIESYPITAVGFDNQGETFVLWDRDTGDPLTDAIVWHDKRGESVCLALGDQIETGWLQRKTGLLLDSYFSAPKLRYLFENDVSLREKAGRGKLLFGTTEGWVLWHLSKGKLHVTDPSTAARTLLYNINELQWDDELLDLFDIPRAILPKVVPSAGYVGQLDFGVGGEIPLHALLVDQLAALFGQACFAFGEMKCTLGTGGFVLMNTGSKPMVNTSGLLTAVAWQLPDKVTYALDGGVFVAGAAVQWLVEGLKICPDAASSSAIAEQSESGAVTFVPALAGLAAPHWKTDVRGGLFGLDRATSQADIVRATLEGVGCRVYEVVKTMAGAMAEPPKQLRVDGGPSANQYLMQFLADLLDMEIQVAGEQEASAAGVAHLAMHNVWGTSLDSLAARWQISNSYSPKMKNETRETILARWRKALDGLERFHQRDMTS
jgi:glycerol kinase